MTDLPMGISPQFDKEEEGNADILTEILTELKKLNTYMVLITDNTIKTEDILIDDENVGP